MASGALQRPSERAGALGAVLGVGDACDASQAPSDALQALRLLGFPFSLITSVSGLQARHLAGSDRVSFSVTEALPYVIEAARRSTRPVVWSSLRSSAVQRALDPDLAHPMSFPVHGPGADFVMVTVGGRLPCGHVGLQEALSVMRHVGWQVLDELSGLPGVRSGLPLTECQVETLRLLAAGMQHSDIAKRHGVSVTGIRRRIDRAMNVLGARSSTQAVVFALLSGQLRASVVSSHSGCR